MDSSLQRLELDKVLERIAFNASFSLGKEAVMNSVPRYSRLIVERDLKRLSDAMRLIQEGSTLSFAGISDVAHLLTRAEKSSILSVHEIVKVTRFMQGISRLKKQFNKLEEDYPNLDDLFTSLIVDEHLLTYLNKTFSEQGEVLDRASNELRTVRSEIKTLEIRIDDSSASFLKKNKEMLSEQVVSLQQGRRTFLLKPSEKNKVPGTVYGTSASGQSVYFEPEFLSNMQNELHGLIIREREEIERICLEASSRIAQDSTQLQANLETVTLIDALFAKAIWGSKEEAVVATLTENRLKLTQARHPLLHKEEAILNDYRLEPPHRSILISGPNTGGKSVSLKTIGLSVLMTLSGCPVVAEKAEVMLVDQVFVDIGDQQSIEKSLSSFSAHIETIKYVVDHASERSLVLLDELGSQTDPLEGESLAMAILDNLRARGSWIVSTTHFSKLKKYGTQHKDILIASVEFDLKTLQPTYRYKEHLVGESNALAIARRLKLDEHILDAAFKYKQEGQYEEDHLLEILESKIQDQEDMKERLSLQVQELEKEKQSLEQKRVEQEKILKEKVIKLEEESDQKIKDLIEEARQQLEVLNTTHRPDLRQKAVQNIEELQDKKDVLEKIEVGDRVRLESSQQIGSVESIDRKEAKVSIGAMSIQVPLKKLRRVSGPIKKVKQRPIHQIRTQSKYQMECNVIGKRVAEALPIVEKYLDDSILKGMATARIVHGHGTGKLRDAVHQSLRRNKQVKDFSLASVSEGGAGATVVRFK